MGFYLTGYKYTLPSLFSLEQVSDIHATSYTYGQIEPNRNSPFFPLRSDEKIMRSDVKEAIVLVNELIEDLGGNIEQNTPLFIANGAFIEDPNKYLKRVTSVYETFTPDMSNEHKIRKIYRSCPPLIALETLTNSTMSYVAQYSGLKFHNATFGNTSQSFYMAINEAVMMLNKKNINRAIVGATNCSGIYSFLMNSGVIGYSQGWKESVGVGMIEVTQSDDAPKSSFCEFDILKHGAKIPKLNETGIHRSWSQILTDKSEFIICSGAFNSDENKKDIEYCEQYSKKAISLFEEYGNMGSANLMIGLAKGVELMNGSIQQVDLLDRDIYGRESLIRLKKC
jgi:hypothetical protein